jgi:histidyl-tRNA synthetase
MLVRGLDYYQGLVFEFISGSIGAQSTFCGGGRYELALRLGSKLPIPSVGAGIGLGRLSMILQEEDLIKITPEKLIAILPLTKDQESLGLIVADFLRKNNQRCELILGIDSVKSKIKQAVKLGAVKAIFIGETEVLENTLTIKDLNTGIEVKTPQSKILEVI